jgi:hypothetical protein
MKRLDPKVNSTDIKKLPQGTIFHNGRVVMVFDLTDTLEEGQTAPEFPKDEVWHLDDGPLSPEEVLGCLIMLTELRTLKELKGRER